MSTHREDDAAREAKRLLPCVKGCASIPLKDPADHWDKCPARFLPAVAAALRARDARIAELEHVMACRDKEGAESLALVGGVMMDKDARIATLEKRVEELTERNARLNADRESWADATGEATRRRIAESKGECRRMGEVWISYPLKTEAECYAFYANMMMLWYLGAVSLWQP